MKTLLRNKTKLYFALYKDKTPIVDDYGNDTGEYKRNYSNPIECYANISPAKGETQTRQFGEAETYDKIIVIDNDFPLIDEYSILWIDTLPKIEENGSTNTPYDYQINKIAKSINSISIAVTKVNVRYE